MKNNQTLTNQRLSQPPQSKKILWVMILVGLVLVFSMINVSATINLFSDNGDGQANGTSLTAEVWDGLRELGNGCLFEIYDNKTYNTEKPGLHLMSAQSDNDCKVYKRLDQDTSILSTNITFWVYDDGSAQSGWLGISNQSLAKETRLGWYDNQCGANYCVMYINGSYNSFTTARSVGWHSGAIIMNSSGQTFTLGGESINIPSSSNAYFSKLMNVSIASYPFTTSSEVFYDDISVIGSSDLITPVVNLMLPLNSTTISQAKFSANVTTINGDNTNATIYVWNSVGAIANQTTNLISGTDVANITNWTVTGLTPGIFTWGVLGCGSNSTASLCSWSGNNYTLNYGASVNSIYWSNVTAETAQEVFSQEITVPTGFTASSAKLYWNGTSYTGTVTDLGSNQYNLTRTLNIPIGIIGDVTFHWNVTFNNGFEQQFDSHPQEVSLLNMILCGNPYTIPFLNFTFKDETAGTVMSAANDLTDFTYWLGDGTATKSYTYSTTTSNPSYAFCFSPADKSVTVDLSFKYSNTSYPIRTFAFDDEALTNTTTNKVLYLLGSSDGIYSSVQILDIVGNPISGVSVSMEREFSGVYQIVEQGVSDSSGLVTFWVNPNFDHRITAVKSGYITAQYIIKPSQTLYSLVLTTTSTAASYNSTISGLRWIVYPSFGTLESGTYNFNATITSYDEAIENCKYELLNVTNPSQVLASSTSVATNATYCYVSFDYTAVVDQNLFGRLSVDTTGTDGYVVLDTDYLWIVIDIEKKSWRSISSFFSDLRDISEFGEGNEGEFSRLVLFFLLATIFIGIFTYFTGFEVSNPGISILVIAMIVLFASAGGFLTFNSGSDRVSSIMEQWSFALMFGILSIGYILNTVRRQGE